MKFLLGELTGKRPLMPPTLQTSAEQADVINTFRTIAQLPPDSLGAYVISMARSASDVLAVVLLQASSTSSTMPGCHATVPSCCHLPHSCLLLVLIALCHARMCQGCVCHMCPFLSGSTPVKCMLCSGQHCLTYTATPTFTTGCCSLVNPACRLCHQMHPVHTPLHQLFYACTLECIASCLLRCNDRSLSQIVIDERESIYAHLAHAAVHGGRLPATSMRIHTRLPCGSLRCP